MKRYVRNDVPDILLRNRFLELFSRPMENRPTFVNETIEKKDHEEIVAVYKGNGTIYERFDLVLPKNSVVRKPEKNKIEIETKDLKMTITVQFDGFCTSLPRGFEEYYIGIKDMMDTIVYQLNINIKVLMKIGALFTKSGWKYYYWVDSFLEEVEKSISKDVFFHHIGWETVLTLLQCLNHNK